MAGKKSTDKDEIEVPNPDGSFENTGDKDAEESKSGDELPKDNPHSDDKPVDGEDEQVVPGLIDGGTLKVEADLPADSYVVTATMVGILEHGWMASSEELGGPENVKRLLANGSIAPADSAEGKQAYLENFMAQYSVRVAKERGN